MHKSHMCRSNEPNHQLIAGYLGHKNQQDDCSGPSEETETCEGSESVDHVLHSVVDNENNYQHKTGEVGSHDNLLPVIQTLNVHLSGFEGHYNCCTLKDSLVAIKYSQCDIPASGRANINEVVVFNGHVLRSIGMVGK